MTDSARPTCDVCGRPVSRFVVLSDEFMGRTRFTVECHGEREVVDVHDDEMRNIHLGRAFTRRKALPA